MGSALSDATVNRELTVLRTSFNNAKKRTPPKIYNTPYFALRKETTIRQGFLPDEVYPVLRDTSAPAKASCLQ
jgi:hypothetical protein